MISSDQAPSSRRQQTANPRSSRLSREAIAGGLALLILIPACGKKPSEAPVAVPTPAVEAVPVPSAAETDRDILQALLDKSAEPAEQQERLREEAQAIMSKYPDKNAEELLQVAEVQTKLQAGLRGLGQDKELQNAINATVDLAAKFKGLSGPPGSFKLNMDIKGYDDTRTQRMLEAVLTEKPRPIVDFLIGELGEAAFEFTFTDAERASNGVSIEASPTPPAATQTPDPDND